MAAASWNHHARPQTPGRQGGSAEAPARSVAAALLPVADDAAGRLLYRRASLRKKRGCRTNAERRIVSRSTGSTTRQNVDPIAPGLEEELPNKVVCNARRCACSSPNSWDAQSAHWPLHCPRGPWCSPNRTGCQQQTADVRITPRLYPSTTPYPWLISLEGRTTREEVLITFQRWAAIRAARIDPVGRPVCLVNDVPG